ncbi:unnamed protein product [Vitrella brassicaformis CCMP3155]|uniref:Folate receptor-like domain-containing protein n=1 Tax=Vitrella brassicaformis (strain CCMP3155) TaxID=1169540 RepID=A0A0G4ENM4_VITBC|nr:unnamed protein product [Vitrella brassicaformis CCMP3155]|eukprot:CEL99203.1 unnamed protein product [Vitrella brassicaformis CCMP3155]
MSLLALSLCGYFLHTLVLAQDINGNTDSDTDLECTSLYAGLGRPGEGGVCFDDAGECNPECREAWDEFTSTCLGKRVRSPTCFPAINSFTVDASAYFNLICGYSPAGNINERDSFITCNLDWQATHKDGVCTSAMAAFAGAAWAHGCAENASDLIQPRETSAPTPAPSAAAKGCPVLCRSVTDLVGDECTSTDQYWNPVAQRYVNYSSKAVPSQLKLVSALFKVPIAKSCTTYITDELKRREDEKQMARNGNRTEAASRNVSALANEPQQVDQLESGAWRQSPPTLRAAFAALLCIVLGAFVWEGWKEGAWAGG